MMIVEFLAQLGVKVGDSIRHIETRPTGLYVETRKDVLFIGRQLAVFNEWIRYSDSGAFEWLGEYSQRGVVDPENWEKFKYE